MAAKTERLGVRLRPHIKTHKCIEIGRMQVERGAAGITVSTLEEAAAFVEAGFNDLTWAFPIIINRLEEVRDLAQRATLRVLVDSVEAVRALEALATPLHVFMKVDCGYGRAGVEPTSSAALEIPRRLSESPTLRFDGLLTHSGHAYSAQGRDAMLAVAMEERDAVVGLAERLDAEGIETPQRSVGSTPAMSVAEDLEGITEARPGNYALYDQMQVALGSCEPADCAATVLTSVVSSHARGSVCDAGALALSKDRGLGEPSSDGRIYADYESGALEATAMLSGLSQEHGKLETRFPVGERLRILPNHSCLTVACFDRFFVLRGEKVVDEWRIHRER